jgi:hypothetical protein
MNIKDFEAIVAEMEMAQEDLQVSLEIQNNLIADLAEITFQSIINPKLIPEAEYTFDKLQLIDAIVQECQDEVNCMISLLSENPN